MVASPVSSPLPEHMLTMCLERDADDAGPLLVDKTCHDKTIDIIYFSKDKPMDMNNTGVWVIFAVVLFSHNR